MNNNIQKIPIACDHAGFDLKEKIKNVFGKEFIFEDFGTFSSESVDYPDMIHPLAKAVNDGIFEKGIIICGSGNGVAMTANKYLNVRAAICWNAEVAALSRQHNDANILSLPARFISEYEAFNIVKIFFSTSFEGGRHQKRVEKISTIL
jgi:ribose 5-phosphate isomerase B